jgi:acylphosphatase
MAGNEIAYHVIISGRVTGVGFRWSAINYARNFSSLRGYIRNTFRDEVEAVIQGPEPEVEMMLEYLRHGPSFARIDSFKANRRPINDNLGFFTIA